MAINGDFLMLNMKIVAQIILVKVDQLQYIINCLKDPKERYSRD